ncbi:hypothetical protein [Paenibacillus terrae]|uniref:Uncharacterized protein n=1 Tax=Paenibacillus terrae TaxID=159743 RepID=A0A0D7WXM6_9BACL|nr:hypothetical protein [Paenibacillus terrae]KJD42492.1 hypothetical protein QD47_27870 [Paenibacillus terrae]
MFRCLKCGQGYREGATHCTKCGNLLYDQRNDTIGYEKPKLSLDKKFILKLILLLAFILFIMGIFSFISSCINNNAPEPKSIDQMTNKELNQFMEWKKEQEQKEYNSSSIKTSK